MTLIVLVRHPDHPAKTIPINNLNKFLDNGWILVEKIVNEINETELRKRGRPPGSKNKLIGSD